MICMSSVANINVSSLGALLQITLLHSNRHFSVCLFLHKHILALMIIKVQLWVPTTFSDFILHAANYMLSFCTKMDFSCFKGRSGRAGRMGEAITLYTEADVPYLRNIANVMAASGCEVPPWIMSLAKKKWRKHRPHRESISSKPEEDENQ